MIRFLISLVIISLLAHCEHPAEPSVPVVQKQQDSGISIDYEVATPNEIIWTTLSIKGDQGRTDNEDGLLSRLQGPRSGMIEIDHTTKTYSRRKPKIYDTDFPPETVEWLDSAWKLSPSGRSQKIGEWDCDEYVVMDTTDIESVPIRMKLVAWIAKDFKDGGPLQARLDQVNGDLMQILEAMKTITGRKLVFPGFVVSLESFYRSKVLMKTTCKRIYERDLDPEFFEIPAGYAEKPAVEATRKPF